MLGTRRLAVMKSQPGLQENLKETGKWRKETGREQPAGDKASKLDRYVVPTCGITNKRNRSGQERRGTRYS